MAVRYRGYQLVGLMVLLLVLVLIGLPALLVRGCNWSQLPYRQQQGPLVRVQVAQGQIVSLPLEQYLIGVVAAEMPTEFNNEALKAQAVAARTYTLLRVSNKDPDSKHPGASLCADPGHCQAWRSTEQMKKEWGLLAFGRNYEKVAGAVRETEGAVLVYQGALIDPVYHSSCGGRGTESASAVWGSDLPYLKSVSCHWDPSLRQQPVITSFSLRDLCAKLRITDVGVLASGGSSLVQVVERTGSGRVSKVQVGTHFYQGTDLRKDMELRSTDFTVKASGNRVTFSTSGYGHAVGMCQYGAEGLAEKGSSYRQILTYYYTGVQIKKMERGSITPP